MRIGSTLRPGQKGTHALQATCGDRLLCVRYRYDTAGRRRLKTAEIIVDEAPWVYCQPRDSPNARRVNLRVGYQERALHEKLKRAGARWNPETGIPRRGSGL